MKTASPRGKRIFLVNRDFQLRYARIAVAVGLASSVLTLFLILFPLFYLEVVRYPSFLPRPFLIGIVAASLVNFAIVALMAIILTHRVAGPMFSLVRQMRVVQGGRWHSHLRVRSTDDMKYVVRNFNELIDYLVAVAACDLAAIDTVLAKLRRGETAPAIAELQDLSSRTAARLIGAEEAGPGDAPAESKNTGSKSRSDAAAEGGPA